MTSPVQAPSMRRIEILDPIVADQIAAGEVIERPASIVKELVENSLDAGAREVHVHLEAGGRDRIVVRDDGVGMVAADAERACLRHATSKLRRIEDLTGIGSLGFRGEALASIAAIAEVEITTRAIGEATGTRVRVEHGVVREVAPTGAPPGTSISVSALFAAVPARRKFLRSAETELGHIVEWLQRMALARPDVGFECVHVARQVLRHPAVRRHDERLRQVLGAERARDLVPIEATEGAISVRGWASRPHTSLGQSRLVLPYVGGRQVRDRLLMRAILDAYRALLPQGRYPVVVAFLEIPGEAVDVNVHPTKTEVRFSAPDAVYGATLRAIRGALAGHAASAPRSVGAGVDPSAGSVEDAARGPDGGTRSGDAISGRVSDALGRYVIRQDASARSSGAAWPSHVPRDGGGSAPRPRESFVPMPLPLPAEESRAPAPAGAPQAFADLRILGQAMRGYIVCEADDGLVLIDQHAAHERVRFERLRAAASETVAGQRLLVPRVIELGDVARARLLEAREELAAAGFEIDEFGERSLVVRALPASLDVTTDPAALLEVFAEELADLGGSDRLAAARDTLAARIACHGAVRVGDPLTPDEMARLVADLDTIPFAATCPHGRPLLIHLRRAEIERRVGRT